MDALILFSHGSLLCGAGETLQQHARSLRGRGGFAVVEVGYMNYTEPAFEEAVERCFAEGCDRIIVTPYFLIPGKFVKVDLQARVAAAEQAHPGITFVVADALGHDSLLAESLLDLADHPRPHDRWRDDLSRAGQFCEADPECPLYGTTRCPKVPGERGKTQGESGERQVASTTAIQNPKLVLSEANGSEIQDPTSALLVLVHGTPRPASNAPMWQVVEEIRSRNAYPIVEVGFMECNEPDIPAAVAACVEQGAGRVIAVPYFLHTGNHVADDLPTAIEEAQERYPDVEFLMCEFLGRAPEMTDLLAKRAEEARNRVQTYR